ncbi:hypothetical protein E1301_Tti020240 [Triplophysa tibetana]|uniref:Uncharacterized protein n=1 Tax=Triplophysa tibetana TaxID=1572043 RepID=A0A5A9NM23_9TELE|nr:hypothetical protein E1301_Tti020240 [Triplophysa tibetana]
MQQFPVKSAARRLSVIDSSVLLLLSGSSDAVTLTSTRFAEAQLGVSSGEQIRFGFSAGLIMMPELGDVEEQHFITSRDAEENQQELRYQ